MQEKEKEEEEQEQEQEQEQGNYYWILQDKRRNKGSANGIYFVKTSTVPDETLESSVRYSTNR